MTAVARNTDQARKLHLAELERMLAGPIPERGLRERIRTEYLNITELENAHVEHRA